MGMHLNFAPLFAAGWLTDWHNWGIIAQVAVGLGAVIFVHGCFWHRHECRIFKWPSTRREFWRMKIDGNADRDQRNVIALMEDGWRVGIVWECATRDRTRLKKIADRCEAWLKSNRQLLEIT